jgi:hypothetical protein
MATVMTDSSLDSGCIPDSADRPIVGYLRLALGWLPVVVILAAASWLLMSDLVRRRVESVPVHGALARAMRPAPPATVGLVKRPQFDPMTSEAITPEQPAPVDGLRISSQSWRRGGLGSNAFVTMTLRNANDYAVRDIEMTCAFADPEGSHLTDRTRLIHDSISGKSRKTFARLHVGFVNPGATKANCSVSAASHL